VPRVKSDRPIYCTQEDLLLGLRRAFAAGQESPYEFMAQEVDCILTGLLDRVKQRTTSESLRKYDRHVESSSRRLLKEQVSQSMLMDCCPKCSQKGVLIETTLKATDESIYSGLCCLRCGWGSSLAGLRKKVGRDYKRPI
jgi:hypothetical protein